MKVGISLQLQIVTRSRSALPGIELLTLRTKTQCANHCAIEAKGTTLILTTIAKFVPPKAPMAVIQKLKC